MVINNLNFIREILMNNSSSAVIGCPWLPLGINNKYIYLNIFYLSFELLFWVKAMWLLLKKNKRIKKLDTVWVAREKIFFCYTVCPRFHSKQTLNSSKSWQVGCWRGRGCARKGSRSKNWAKLQSRLPPMVTPDVGRSKNNGCSRAAL